MGTDLVDVGGLVSDMVAVGREPLVVCGCLRPRPQRLLLPAPRQPTIVR